MEAVLNRVEVDLAVETGGERRGELLRVVNDMVVLVSQVFDLGVVPETAVSAAMGAVSWGRRTDGGAMRWPDVQALELAVLQGVVRSLVADEDELLTAALRRYGLPPSSGIAAAGGQPGDADEDLSRFLRSRMALRVNPPLPGEPLLLLDYLAPVVPMDLEGPAGVVSEEEESVDDSSDELDRGLERTLRRHHAALEAGEEIPEEFSSGGGSAYEEDSSSSDSDDMYLD